MDVWTSLGYASQINAWRLKLDNRQVKPFAIERIKALRMLLSGKYKVPAPDSPSFKGAERAYGGKDAYKRAKQSGKTKLDYNLWVEVRTPEFKQWFGDFEAVKGVAMLEGQMPMNLDGVEPVADQKEAEELFGKFKDIPNEHDGRKVTFPVNKVGKILRHKGFGMEKIVRAFDSLFKAAIPMTSELEEPRPGHKDHTSNIAGYHHYVNNFERDGKTYYIRFTVHGMMGGHGKEGQNLTHSASVSDVTLYEQGAEKGKGASLILPASGLLTRAHSEGAPLDDKLAQWFEKGKENLRGKTDPQTGEPLASEIGLR
ncbi:MAG: hypothetical protein LBQ75_02390 [Zoogloeaceae bacterium]|jgi:hypothetical protein|nr:hypothetical protein [Zoogloeaceae bacterium]